MKGLTIFLYAAACGAVALPIAVDQPEDLAPSQTLAKRADFCGQWDSAVTGPYTVYNNLWNMSAGVGSQCTGVDGLRGNSVSWHTQWSWAMNPGNVKSYANAVVKMSPLQLPNIKSLQSTWAYTYTGNNLIANVAYDLFTSASNAPNAKHDFEIMIWLNALGGAGPISTTGNSPIATPNVAGKSWRLFSGPNGSMKVFSFVASSPITNFSGDLNEFLIYLRGNQGLPRSQWLVNIGAGTEPFTGSNANFRTSAYSVVVS